MNLVGHEGPYRQWRFALAGKRMHHGWILSGRRGLGKMSFALQAARELVAEGGVPQPIDHPDIIVLSNLPSNAEEEKKRDEGKPYQLKRNITVDQVRAMQHRLTTRPTLGSRRAIIIDPADDLEKGASNALLKSLEEPPAGSYFILVAHKLGKLLPTIRSRCRVVRFPRIEDEQIDLILQQRTPQASQSTRAAAIAASGGSPGAALDFVELDLGSLYTLLSTIAERGDAEFQLRGQLAEAMGTRPDRQRQLAAIELARGVVASSLAGIQGDSIPVVADTYAELDRLAAQAPTYNFDPGLLVMEIGSLLASLAVPREAAHG